MAPLAQWIAHWTSNPGVAGSSPVRGVAFRANLAQLGERQTEDLKVPGSIPGVGS